MTVSPISFDTEPARGCIHCGICLESCPTYLLTGLETESPRGRIHLMQQLSHLFYTLVFLFVGRSGQPVDWSSPVPAYGGFMRRMWDGEFELRDNGLKAAFARVHWSRLLENVRQPRYAEALKIVTAGR